VQQADLEQIQAWFDGYLNGYLDLDPEGLKNIRLKQEHTAKVVEVMGLLAVGERLTASETCLARAVALLHDVGRFPQYRRWRTFRDSESDNHARLGLEVIRQQQVLQRLGPEDQLLIEEAVRFHNLLAVPSQFKSPTDRYIRLIRDADKLDIWRVFEEYFQQPPAERASAVGLGLPDQADEITAECLAALQAGEVVRLDTVRVLNDFILLQISWAYDLNVPSAFRLLQQRCYLTKLAALLPPAAGLDEAIHRAVQHVRLMAER
jgi:hypothetical protein